MYKPKVKPKCFVKTCIFITLWYIQKVTKDMKLILHVMEPKWYRFKYSQMLDGYIQSAWSI